MPPARPPLGPHVRLENLIGTWGLVVQEIRETPTSLLALGERAGLPVVLKVARAPGDEWQAGAIIRAFNGEGMVRSLEIADGAVLLERLTPGTPLANLSLAGRDDEATEILAGVIDLLSASEVPPGCPTVTEWGRGFASYLRTGDRQIPRPLVKRAQAWYLELAESQRAVRLLHGDLQHYNILRDSQRGWVAIDPKGVIGELEYELGAGLRNPAERLEGFSSPRAIERRLAGLGDHLLIARDRTLAWAYAQAVLSAIWMIEDGAPVAPDDPVIRLAQGIEGMLPPPQ